ncbi:MAG: hypothetical protein JXR83_18965 [Deltaproteobacteria bacterium]|nr:hypothetical protein [Deltaproteobacteria bacterium]
MATDQDLQAIESARLVAVEVLGQLAEFWGFTRTMGRVFGLLYLSPEPLSQAEISESLSISAASVSLSLNALMRWGAVRKSVGARGRKVRYEAETEFRKFVTSVLASRERQQLEDGLDAVAHAVDKLQRLRSQRGELDEGGALFVLERLQHLESVYRMSYQLLQLLLRTGRIDVEAVAEAEGHPIPLFGPKKR